MQITIDGFVSGPIGEMDWMNFNWGNDIMSYIDELTDSSGTIILGRKMTEGFIPHWTNMTSNPDDPSYAFGKKMVDLQKVVFTKTLDKSPWSNTILAKGDMVEEVEKLKNQQGKDIIVYGGVSFVSSLVGKNLIDEYHLFINPAAIGKGLTIFNNLNNRLNLTLIKSISFDCGIVVNRYEQDGKSK